MDLIQYRDQHVESGHDAWGSLAERLGSSKAYISQLAHGHRKASHQMARKIEVETNGQVTRADLRPDIFGPIDEAAA
jgi:DNA-binding transcriptional regulator YdaS (Cro superfamily)